MTDFSDREVHEHEVAAARQELEDLLAGRGVSLSDRELWEDPTESGVPTSKRAVATRRPLSRWIRWTGTGIAAAAALAVGIAIGGSSGAGPADWEITLIPTSEAPNARAVVQGWNTSSGTRLALDIDGLDDPPDGYVYELWFSNRDRHISAGTFATPQDLEMLVGIRRGDFPRVWITLEPLDADPGPGVTVLDVES